MKKIILTGALACACQSAVADDLSTFDLGTLVVTPTRFAASSEHAFNHTTVITRDDIKQGTAHSIPEILAQRAGVKISNVDGTSDNSLDLRGFGKTGDQNIVVLVDGQKLSEIEIIAAKLSTIPLDAIERIEVVHGSGAVLYGGGATGGVINIITTSQAKAASNAAVGMKIGSYQANEVHGSATIVGEDAQVSVYANRFDTNNYRQNNAVTQNNVQLQLALNSPTTRMVLKFNVDEQNLRLPGSRTEAQLQTDRRGTATPNDFSSNNGSRISFGSNSKLGNIEMNWDASYRERATKANYVSSSFEVNTAVDVAAVNPRIKYSHTALGSPGHLIVGLDSDKWNYASTNNFGNNARATQTNNALYFLNELQLENTTQVLFGGRSHNTQTTLNGQNQTRNVVAYEFGARHTLSKQLALRAKVGRGFRIATVDENYDSTNGVAVFLEPQTSKEYELGLDGQFGPMRLRATGYLVNLKNEIHYQSLVPPFGANINLAPTRRSGIETEAQWKVAPTIDLFATYNYTRAKFREGSYGGVNVTGKDIPLVPRQRATLGASWRLTGATSLSGDVGYVGEQRFDNDQANTFGRLIPSYTVANLKLSHEIAQWRLSASINNVFDKKYFSYGIKGSGTSFNAYPEAERQYLVSAEYRFK